MPKHKNRTAVSDRLARRVHSVDTKRLDLLEKLLEESSSTTLNDTINQTNAKQVLEEHSKLLDLIDEVRQVESKCNPQLPSRDEQAWKSFFQWIDSNSNSQPKLSQLVDVSRSTDDEQEYSLVAKVPFKKGTPIYGIHRRAMLSTETAMKDHDLFEFIKNDSIASAMQNVVLVLHLLNEHSKGDKSQWSSYLAILPNKILPVLTLDKAKLQHLLASAHIFESLKMIRAIARQYSYFFKRLQAINLPLAKNFTYKYYCWGVTMVCSRQNEIPPSDRLNYSLPVVHALIPVLDMCNHNHQSSQATFEENQSKLIACTDLEAGNEITINYGARTSGDFYIHNGFVPKEVPYDALPMAITLNSDSPLYSLKVKLLKILNMPAFGRFKLTRNDHLNRHRRDPHLTMFLIVYLLEHGEIEFILDSDNPVGLADEIYTFIHYDDIKVDWKKFELEGDVEEKVLRMPILLPRRVREYLSRRASIGIALIERTLGTEEQLETNLIKLLENEKFIYLSHVTEIIKTIKITSGPPPTVISTCKCRKPTKTTRPNQPNN